MTAPVPRDADQDHTDVDRGAARGPRRAPAAGRRVRRRGRALLPRRGRAPAADRAARRPGRRRVACSAAAYEVGCLDLGRNTLYDAARSRSSDETYLRPPVWSSVDLRHRRARPRCTAARRPGFDPDALRRGAAYLPGARRHRRCPAVLLRHRDTPLDGTAPALDLRLRRLRGRRRARVGPGAAQPARPRRRVGARADPRRWRGRPALVARRQHAAQAAHASTTWPRWPTGSTGEGLVDGDRIATRGLSAGGLLQGAVFSQRPERWRAVVAEVPFVDVVTTMFDATIPLTITEWEEWGDPRDPRAVRLAARLLAVRQPAAGRRPPRPAGHRRRARPAGDGARAGQVGGRAPRDRPGVVAAAACSAARPAPARTSARPVGSGTSPTRPRSTPGSWTGWGSRHEPPMSDPPGCTTR